MRVWLLITALVSAAVIYLAGSATGSEISQGKQQTTTLNREQRGAKKNKAANSECKYRKGEWGECSPTNNQKTRILTLKRGDQNECEPTRTEAKKCKKQCRYQKGPWTQCNADSYQMERIDQLKPGGDPSCEANRRLTRKCKGKTAKSGKSAKKSVCQYDRNAEWQPCDSSTGIRTKVRQLVEGDPKSCASTKTQTRPCKNAQGKDRCFYGNWGEWSACENGVQRKSRPVQSGGARCQGKAVRTKQCNQKRRS